MSKNIYWKEILLLDFKYKTTDLQKCVNIIFCANMQISNVVTHKKMHNRVTHNWFRKKGHLQSLSNNNV